MHLLQGANGYFEWAETDETLLKELAETLFQSNRYRTLYEQCQSQQDGSDLERVLIDELVETYQQISNRQQASIVQQLNALL
jgi:vacuolar-type H+-ATPase subunit C/Vma6